MLNNKYVRALYAALSSTLLIIALSWLAGLLGINRIFTDLVSIFIGYLFSYILFESTITAKKKYILAISVLAGLVILIFVAQSLTLYVIKLRLSEEY